LGSSLMSPINSGLGTTPLNMRNMDPRMKTMGAFGGYGGEYGGLPTGMPSGGTLQAAAQNNPLMQVTKDGMVVLSDNVPQLTKDIGAQLNTAKQAEIDAQQRFVNAERGSDERSIAQKMVSEAQYEQQILTNQLLSSRGPGGGTSVTIGGSSGGGFFSGGPLAEVGNMALDLGKSAITQKVVQSLGIKNPYMSMLASFAINKGVSYLGGKAFDMFAGTDFGGSLISGAKDLLPSWLGGSTFTSNPAAYSGFAPTGTQYGAFGEAPTGLVEQVPTAGVSPVVPGFEAVAPYLPYIPAFVALLKGDVGGAVGYAAGAFVGSAIGTSLAEAGFAFGGPIGAVAGFLIGSFLGGLFGGGGGGYTPNPTIWRIIRVSGNNNINSIVDLQAPKDNPPKEFFELCDALLKVGFNATKVAESATKKSPPFDFLMTSMNGPDGVYFSMRKGDPTSADTYAIHLGKADKSFSAGKAASEIVKLITTAFKEAYAADATALDNAVKLLNKKTFKELSTDLTKELKKGTDKLGTGKLDTSIERGVFGGTVAQDAMIVAGRANAPQAAVSSYGDYGGSDSPPMVYSIKEGKYVEAPSEMKEVVDEDSYAYQRWGMGMANPPTITKKVYTPGVLMLDKDGNPIFDRNNSGGIDLADITYVKPLSDTTTFMSAAVPVLKDLMYPGATTATAATTATTTTPVTVVTNADNSQRNNQSVNTYYASTLSKTKNPIKDAMLQTGMPA